MTRSRSTALIVSISSAVLGACLPLVLPSYWAHVFAVVFIKIILCLALRQMMLCGLLNLSIVSFMAIGAYFSALFTTTYGVSFWLIMPLSGVLCFIIGTVFSFPVLRLKGAYFFIGTVCLAVGVNIFFSNFFVSLLGGVPGFTPIAVPRIALLGIDFRFQTNRAHYYLTYFVMLLSIFLMWRLEVTRYGLYWKAIEQADRLLEAVGVSLFKYKMLNFAISCFFAGISGSLYAPITGIITPHDFGLEFLFILVALLVVGGVGDFWGPVAGVVTLSVVAELMRDFGQYETISYGFILVFAMLFIPKGIMGMIRPLFAKMS
jgi:branched-chain amino acid transport system permease protein